MKNGEKQMDIESDLGNRETHWIFGEDKKKGRNKWILKVTWEIGKRIRYVGKMKREG